MQYSTQARPVMQGLFHRSCHSDTRTQESPITHVHQASLATKVHLFCPNRWRQCTDAPSPFDAYHESLENFLPCLLVKMTWTGRTTEAGENICDQREDNRRYLGTPSWRPRNFSRHTQNKSDAKLLPSHTRATHTSLSLSCLCKNSCQKKCVQLCETLFFPLTDGAINRANQASSSHTRNWKNSQNVGCHNFRMKNTEPPNIPFQLSHQTCTPD